jgi:hypothetical protein
VLIWRFTIIELAQSLARRDISKSVDGACAFRVMGAVVTEVPPFLVILLWRVKKALRRFATLYLFVSTTRMAEMLPK